MELRQWTDMEMLREHHNDLLREAGLVTQRRLAFEDTQNSGFALADRTLARLGHKLVVWGHQLERRYSTAPEQGLPANADC